MAEWSYVRDATHRGEILPNWQNLAPSTQSLTIGGPHKIPEILLVLRQSCCAPAVTPELEYEGHGRTRQHEAVTLRSRACAKPRLLVMATSATRLPSSRAVASIFSLIPGESGPVDALAPKPNGPPTLATMGTLSTRVSARRQNRGPSDFPERGPVSLRRTSRRFAAVQQVDAYRGVNLTSRSVFNTACP
jgi:hypothetical protein